MLSQQFDFNKSKNFTSDCWMRIPPIIPIAQYRSPKPINSSGDPFILSNAIVFNAHACSEHSNFLKVNCMNRAHGTVKRSGTIHQYAKRQLCTHPEGGPPARCRIWTTSILTTATLIYTVGAGITAAAGTRLALQSVFITHVAFVSFQVQDNMPCIVIYCHYLPVSRMGNLRACCLP